MIFAIVNAAIRNDDLYELVCAAQQGQTLAARQLYDRFQRALMGYCLSSTRGDRDAAKDLLQEIFIKAFKHLNTLEHPERFSAWLWTIAHRTCATYGSKSQKHDLLRETFALECEALLDPEDKIARERRIACVQKVLSTIEDNQLARIVELKYTDPEHTTRQIAQRLNIPHGTVTVSLMRFRKSIKRQLIMALEQDEVSP